MQCMHAQSCPTLCYPIYYNLSRILCPWNFLSKNTGVGCYFLHQGIFPNKGSKLHLWHLLHWQVDSLPLVPTEKTICYYMCNLLYHAYCYIHNMLYMDISVQFSSVAQSFPTLCDPMNRSMPGLPVHYQLLEFTQTHAHRVGDAIQPSHLLSSPSPPAPNPSKHQVFSNESSLRMRWPKYWSFSFSISPSNGHPGLISFRMDWLDLLAGQGTLKSLLQYHTAKASIFWCSVFFTVQLSHPYMTTGKNHSLD